MGFFEAFRAAWGSLKANKLRTWLTLLGMIIGVFAIIASVTAVKVIDVYFKDSLNLLGSGSFSVSRYPAVTMHGGRREERRAITFTQMEELQRSITMPLTISPEEDFDMTAIRAGDRETEPNVMVVGSNEHYPANFGYEIADGRGLTELDVQYGRSVAVLGKVVAEHLFPNASPLGKSIVIRGHRYLVVGVFAEKGSFIGFSWDNRVVAPVTTMFNRYGQTNRSIAFSVRTADPMQVAPAMEHVIGHMRRIRKVPPGEENDFELSTNDSIQSIFEGFTNTLTIGGAGIGLIALLAAGIGIMNIMLVSVTERTREIGIRKSIGARRKDIMRQFLLEAFFMCQFGGLFGVILGAAFGNLTALYFKISATFPMNWAIGGFVMVTVIALVFGVYPAFKAASLDPIESLRHE